MKTILIAAIAILLTGCSTLTFYNPKTGQTIHCSYGAQHKSICVNAALLSGYVLQGN